MRRLLMLVFAVAVLAVPAHAVDDREGFYVEIQAAGVQAGNDDVVLGIPLDPVDVVIAGPAVTLDQGSGLAGAVEFGYKGFEWDLAVTLWGYDETADTTAFDPDPSDGVPDLLLAWGHPAFADFAAERLDGTSNLQSGLVDVAWSRMMFDTDRSVWHWTLGLRVWSLERELILTSDLDPDAGVYDDRLFLDSESTGAGLLAGIRARYEFTPKIWGSTAIRFAFLTGSTDVRYEEDSLFGGLLFTGIDGADRNFVQMDLDTRINFNVAGGFDLFLASPN